MNLEKILDLYNKRYNDKNLNFWSTCYEAKSNRKEIFFEVLRMKKEDLKPKLEQIWVKKEPVEQETFDS